MKLKICWFKKMVAVGSPSRFMMSLALGSYLVSSARLDFPSIEWILSPFRELLVNAKV